MNFFNTIVQHMYFGRVKVQPSIQSGANGSAATMMVQAVQEDNLAVYQTVQIGSRLGGRGVMPEGGYSILNHSGLTQTDERSE